MLVRSVLARPRRVYAKVLAAALAGALSLGVAASAVAVEGPLASLDITLLVQSQGGGEPLMLVAGQLPEGTQLPAEIALPVPEGAVVEWSGEILGTEVENDIPAEARIEQRDGANVVVFTLTQSLTGQAEVSYPNAVDPVDGYAYVGGYNLVAPVDAEAVRMAVALPPGGQPASLPEGTLSAQGPQGYTYYYQELNGVSAGDPLILAIQFGLEAVQPATGAGTGQPASSEVPPLVIVLIAAALAGAVLAVFASRSRSKGAAMADEVGSAEAMVADDAEGVEPVVIVDAESGETDADVVPAETDTPADTPAPASSSWLTPQRLVIIAGVLVVGIIVAVILGGQQGQVGVTEISNGVISERISDASGESTVELNTIISCDCPPEAEIPKMFDALRTVPGVAHASVEEATLLMRVEYDPALTDEAAISAVLRQAGYLP
jgi:hypothetical protein